VSIGALLLCVAVAALGCLLAIWRVVRQTSQRHNAATLN
jgi:hypothetical protein